MTYSPVTAGEAFPLVLTLRQDNGLPLPLADAVGIGLVFAPTVGSPGANQRFAATGSVSITDADSGEAFFLPSAGDGSRLLAGQWTFQAVVTYVGGSTRYSRPIPLEVVDPL